MQRLINKFYDECIYLVESSLTPFNFSWRQLTLTLFDANAGKLFRKQIHINSNNVFEHTITRLSEVPNQTKNVTSFRIKAVNINC